MDKFDKIVGKEANDNFERSIKSFDSYDDMAMALAEHLGCLVQSTSSVPEVEIKSVITRTNSIPALQTLVQKVQGVSLAKLVIAYIDDLLKPSLIENKDASYTQVSLDMCIEGVISATLERFFLGDDSSDIPEAFIRKHRIVPKNYFEPRFMKKDVQQYRAVIIHYVAYMEHIFEEIRAQALDRLIFLRNAEK
jgi:hypothetical protein